MYILINEDNMILELAYSDTEYIERFKKVLLDEYANDINTIEEAYKDNNTFKNTENSIERIRKFAQATSELLKTDTIEILERHIENRGWKVIENYLEIDKNCPDVRSRYEK